MLVPLQIAGRHDLVGEVGRRPAALRLEREGVLRFARDAGALGDVLARLAHRLEREALRQTRVGKAPAERRVVDRLVPARKRLVRLGHDQRRAAHRLCAARDEEVAVPRRDRVAGRDDCRQPRGAEPVHGHARDRLRQPGEQRRHPSDVAVVLAGLVGSAEVDVFDLARVDAGALHRGGDRDRRQVVGPHPGEPAAVAADRRTDGGQDDCAAHERYPL
jgi:hypothetical protein